MQIPYRRDTASGCYRAAIPLPFGSPTNRTPGPTRRSTRTASPRNVSRFAQDGKDVHEHGFGEPWWKTLRSLALKGRRFVTWEEVCGAVRDAVAYWNAHRHPFVWGRRRRHQPRRLGVALLPKAA